LNEAQEFPISAPDRRSVRDSSIVSVTISIRSAVPRRSQRLLGTTALAALSLAVATSAPIASFLGPILLPTPASAAGGAGGTGGGGGGAIPGGSGGGGFTGNPGNNGTNGFAGIGGGAGGGGGGGAGGGSGGNGGGPGAGAGGAGGTLGHIDGFNGNDGTGNFGGGGGGGGGFNGNGTGTPTITNGATLSGGNGGQGGAGADGGAFAAASGGGGAGGFGAIVTGAGASSNSGSITGGTGGVAGFAGDGGGSIGSGGDGGVGVQFTAGGATLTNSGTITGGNGAAGRVEGIFRGASGAGGAGVVGADLTIVNSGTISGGSGANAVTYTGGNNFLTLSSGGTVGSLVGGIGITGLLQIDPGSNNVTLANVIQGTGDLTKIGADTLILSGTNTYTGTTTVNAGTLEIDGSITSSSNTSVVGGALTGVGTVSATQVNAGGIFAPGNGTPGTSMTVASLALASGAFYVVQINPATSSFANVTGTATLGGATVNATFTNGSYAARQYTILKAAGGVSGTFGSLNTNLPSAFQTTLSYDAHDAFLNLTANLGGGAGGSLSGNQQAVATAVNNAFNSGGALPAGFVNLFNLSGAALSNALTQVSGETATGSQQTTFDAMGQFMGLLTDPFMNRGGGSSGPQSSSSGYAEEDSQTSAYANDKRRSQSERDAYVMFTKAPLAKVYDPHWSVWVSGFGGSQSTNGNALVGSNSTTSNIAGTAVGADYLISLNTIAGFALAGGGTNFSVANGGTGRSDLFQAGAYVRHNAGPAYISAALAYGWQDITTNRSVTVAGLDQLRAEFNANAWSGRVEGGYRFVTPTPGGIGITPYAAAQFVTFDLPAYAEQAIAGSNNFALAYGARDVTDARTELGIRTDKSFAMANGILTLRGRFAWAHDYDPDRAIGATFQTLPGASFVVNGAAQAAESALTTASVEMKWKNGWSAGATFEGEFSNVTASYAGKDVVRYVW
jgi:uncharacterized protein with beta-barrel porin domain